MATLSETLNLVRQINSIYKSFLPRLNAIIDQISAIDPAAPDATTRLDQLNAQYNTIRDEGNAQLNPLRAAYITAFNSLSERDKERANNDPASSEGETLSEQVSAAGAKRTATVNEKRAAITRANPPPATPTIDNTEAPPPADPAGNNALQGAASDDSGSEPDTPNSEDTEETAGSESPSINAPESPEAERESENEADDTKGTPPYENEEFFRVEASPGDRPGRRLKNPLGYLASYTYQLSLYMISPDAYDAFIAGGRRNLDMFNEQFVGSIDGSQIPDRDNKGVFLVAQSGGSATADRSPEFRYDYYIDDLSFTHLSTAQATGSAVGNLNFTFKIIEPYGFSLITNLKNAQNRIRGGPKTGNPTNQFFILGIRFFGWDQSGRKVLGNEVIDGSELDINSTGDGAIFQTFYDIVVTEVKFKIDGKASVYAFKANIAPQAAAVNLRNGMVNTAIEASGSTVREMLSGPTGLITKLNEEQENLKNNGTVTTPVVYKIKWIGDAEQMAIASVVSETRTNKANQPGVPAKNTEEVNESADVTANPNNTQARLSFSNVPITQAIDQIIARSKYIEDAMVKNYEDTNEADPDTKSFPSKSSPNKKFKWFRITPEISNIDWDENRKDWTFTITYRIETYLVPIVDNPYVQNNVVYYGPHKRYNYWYTGENSEIISYEQQLNNLFMNNVMGGSLKNNNVAQPGDQSGNAGSVPGQGAKNAVNAPVPGDSTGSGGTPSDAAVNSVRTTLYDPQNHANAKISILGDPDFLMQEASVGLSGAVTRSLSKAYSRFYDANSFTINPTGGQVFIEIDFKEGVDYSSNEFNDSLLGVDALQSNAGTLAINDSILFWDYDAEVKKKIKGISYKLISVVSNFKNGSFTQTLTATINDFGTRPALTDEARQDLENEATGEEPNPATAADSTGTTQDPETPNNPAGVTSNQPAAPSAEATS
jgi:hypothetical protein